MARAMGIDFGKKRIGLARSDPMKQIAFPFKQLIAQKKLEETVDAIHQECRDADLVVIGLPLLLSGKDSEMTTLVRTFAKQLEEKGSYKVVLWDERLTSKQVEKLMMFDNVSRKKRTQHTDTLSATLILQTYLETL